MKILHVITTIDAGGAERHLLELSSLQKREGNEVFIYPLKGKLELLHLFMSAGIKVQFNQSNNNFLFQYLKLSRFIEKVRFDIIHSHLPRSEVLVSLLPRLHYSKYILTKHNAETIIAKTESNPFSILLARFIEIRFNHIICISNAVLNFLISRGEVTTRNKWSVIYYGSDKQQHPYKIYQKKNGEPMRIVTVSRLVVQKNLFLIIETAALLHLKKVNFVWHIYGDGPLRSALQLQIDTYGLKDKLLLVGKKKQIEDFLPNYDCFVLASKYEGFGFSIFEALSCGLPILLSRIPSSLEIFESNYEGFFDPDNAESLLALLRKFINESSFSIALQSSLPKIFERFSSNKMLVETDSVYTLGGEISECL